MPYVLDTNAIVDFQTGHPTLTTNVLGRPFSELAISVITVEEVLSGWYTLLRRAKTPDRLALAYERLADSVSLLGKFPILPFDLGAMKRFEVLKSSKLGVRHMDLRIASIVMEQGGTLVTSNLQDFNGVPGLVVEDWRLS